MALDPALLPVVDGPNADGFTGWTFPGDGFSAWIGRLETRPEGADTIRVRAPTGPSRANVAGSLHGGFLLGLLDQALFAGPVAIGRLEFGNGVTLGVSTQFLAAGRIDLPIDCLVTIVRETRRLMFLTGHMEQGAGPTLTYQATLSRRVGSRA